jgi:hypothetical protein
LLVAIISGLNVPNGGLSKKVFLQAATTNASARMLDGIKIL